MPVIIIILYTDEFLPMAGICVMAGLFQLHRSVALPLEYVSLAHGHSWMFMILEAIYNTLTIALVYAMYKSFGLNGIGMALSAVGIANTIILAIVNKYFYYINVSGKNWGNIIIDSCMVLAIIVLCMNNNLVLRLGIGIPLTILSAIYSYRTVSQGIKDEA
jgi:hypothetical protein